MHPSLTMRLLPSLFLFAVMSCNTADSMTASTRTTLPRIEVTTDGGITGRGLGGVTFEKDSGTATTPGSSCQSEITAVEKQQLARAVDSFKAVTQDDVQPDQIHYILTVDGRTASWYGEQPPDSATQLFHVAWQIRQRILGSCR